MSRRPFDTSWKPLQEWSPADRVAASLYVDEADRLELEKYKEFDDSVELWQAGSEDIRRSKINYGQLRAAWRALNETRT